MFAPSSHVSIELFTHYHASFSSVRGTAYSGYFPTLSVVEHSVLYFQLISLLPVSGQLHQFIPSSLMLTSSSFDNNKIHCPILRARVLSTQSSPTSTGDGSPHNVLHSSSNYGYVTLLWETFCVKCGRIVECLAHWSGLFGYNYVLQ